MLNVVVHMKVLRSNVAANFFVLFQPLPETLDNYLIILDDFIPHQIVPLGLDGHERV